MPKGKKKVASLEEMAALEFEPIDFKELGFEMPANAKEWRNMEQNNFIIFRLAIALLQRTKDQLVEDGVKDIEGELAAERIYDEIERIEGSFSAMASLMKTAAVRLLSVLAVIALREKQEAHDNG